MTDELHDDGNGRLTIGRLRQFIEDHGLSDDTLVYVEREWTDPDTHKDEIFEDEAVGAKATVYASGGAARLVILIDAVDTGD